MRKILAGCSEDVDLNYLVAPVDYLAAVLLNS